MFVLGCPDLIVTVDHAPLAPIFNNRDLEKIPNPRVRKFREKTLIYKFKVIPIPGSKNPASDVYSRLIPPPPDERSNLVAYIEDTINASVYTPDTIKLSTINEHCSADRQFINLRKLIQEGFPPNKSSLPHHLREFWPMRDDLYATGNLVFIRGTPLIPKSLRRGILEELHIGIEASTG